MLLQNTEYKNGFSDDHPAVRMFWSVFHKELSLEDKKKFLCKNNCKIILQFNLPAGIKFRVLLLFYFCFGNHLFEHADYQIGLDWFGFCLWTGVFEQLILIQGTTC